jgi:hypothetical protein
VGLVPRLRRRQADPPPVAGVRDDAVARQLAVDGYARLGPFLTSDQIDRARHAFDVAAARLDRPLGDQWYPTILWPEDDVRAFITSELEALIAPRLESVFDPEVLELMRLDYSVKPASPTSELGAHQDFSLIDETQGTSLYLWIPLVDADETNGTLHVVPRSHRFSNRIRSQHVPAYFDEVLPLVRESAVRLDCRAGELIVMVSGVIHFSPPNRSDALRLAAHGIVKPVDAPIVFFFADEQTPADKVECYEVDLPRYVHYIHHGRPGAEVPLTRMVDRPPASMTSDRFQRGLKQVGGTRA